MDAEGTLAAWEGQRDARRFIDTATRRVKGRVFLGCPSGANQGMPFPFARARAALKGVEPGFRQGCPPLGRRRRCGEQADMARMLPCGAP